MKWHPHTSVRIVIVFHFIGLNRWSWFLIIIFFSQKKISICSSHVERTNEQQNKNERMNCTSGQWERDKNVENECVRENFLLKYAKIWIVKWNTIVVMRPI